MDLFILVETVTESYVWEDRIQYLALKAQHILNDDSQ